MNILKEGAGCSDEQLFENCRYNLLWRKAPLFLFPQIFALQFMKNQRVAE